MSRTKILYPIIILILSIAALAASFTLYIYWYLEASKGLHILVKRFQLDKQIMLKSDSWVVIVVLSVLVGFIFICIFMIFIYNQKNLRLYRMQHNFINNFTHELKTPVTSLKLYLETFQKHVLSREDQLKYIRYMIQDASRLSENINHILNLAKIEAKSYSEDTTVVNLVETIDEFIRDNQHLFKKAEIKVHNPTDKPFFHKINKPLFDMLLMNLITNAIKYNDAKVPTVDISFRHIKKTLTLSFRDNGIGIDKKDLKKIFKKFYQVGSTELMSAKGTGIGLYLVSNIAKIHKGKIKAESDGRGTGSVFTLMLPYYSVSKIA